MTYSVVAFLGRAHGLAALKAVIDSDEYNPVAVFTHRKKATFEDTERNERPDYKEYASLCEQNNIPLYAIDSKKSLSIVDEYVSNIRAID